MSELQLGSYRVVRFTAFTFSPTQPRKERERFLGRVALAAQTKLRKIGTNLDAEVMQVRVGSVPQLRFAVTVWADTREEAGDKGTYWIRRGLTARIGTGRGSERKELKPPWGVMEVQRG